MEKLAFLPFMMLGIATGAFLCDCAEAHWHAIALKDVAILVGLYIVIILLGIFFARRNLLGFSARMWAFAITVSYAVGLVGIVLALRPEVLFQFAGWL